MKYISIIFFLFIGSYGFSQESIVLKSTTREGIQVFESTGVEKKQTIELSNVNHSLITIAQYSIEQCEAFILDVKSKIEYLQHEEGTEQDIENYKQNILEAEKRIIELKNDKL